MLKVKDSIILFWKRKYKSNKKSKTNHLKNGRKSKVESERKVKILIKKSRLSRRSLRMLIRNNLRIRNRLMKLLNKSRKE
jgi:hypothetical protein